MPRHPLPRALAELRGTVKANPRRYKKVPPEVQQPLGDAPEHLSATAKAVWFEISTYAPVNVLRGADRIMLEMIANLLAEYRASPEKFAVGKYPSLIGLLGRLGMSPADRQKLGVEKSEEQDNPFEAF